MNNNNNRPFIILGVSMGVLLICVFTWIIVATQSTEKPKQGWQKDNKATQNKQEEAQSDSTWDEQYLPPKDSVEELESEALETEEVEEKDTRDENTREVNIEEIDKVLVTMTMREKVCQMFFVSPEKLTGVAQVTAAGAVTKESLHRYPVGGILYSQTNLISEEQIRSLLRNVQKYAKTDLYLALDEEGGDCSALGDLFVQDPLDSMFTYREKGKDVAYKNAKTIAANLRKYRFNMNFSPVADVWSNEDSTLVQQEAYSDDFYEASQLVSSAVKGYADRNVICLLKHFPGLGEAQEASDEEGSYIEKTKSQLKSQELMPFETGIEAGADFVMVGHAIILEMDEEPASLSENVVHNFLRNELNYEEIIITDQLQKQALTAHYSNAEIAVKAVQAGNDMLFEPRDLDGAVEAILEAVKTGTISEERINESVRRILRVKMEHGIID